MPIHSPIANGKESDQQDSPFPENSKDGKTSNSTNVNGRPLKFEESLQQTRVRQPPIRPLWRRILHWGPLLAISVIAQISTASIYCHLAWWPPGQSILAAIHFFVFSIWVFSTLSHLISAAYDGPGYVPLGWTPEKPSDQRYLQYCVICEGYKAPRSHHCRKCNRCVMKMDHHCPWINNCCGFANQAAFTKFLISGVIGCMQAVGILGPSIYRAIFRMWYLLYGTGREPIVEIGLYGIVYAIFAFGLAIGVVLSVGFLFVVQMRSILRNRTGIEDYIMAKAEARRRKKTPKFVYPYNVGWKRNFLQVFPLFGDSEANGIFYPVVAGCDQYTLTTEQIAQKYVKKRNAVEYIIVRNFGGGFCACSQGCRVMCCQPWSEEPRIPISQGDRILVTRWHKFWLYGEKVVVERNNTKLKGTREQKIRGWFPRHCARDLNQITEHQQKSSDSEHEKED